MPLTPRLQVPYPAAGDPNDVPSDLQAIAEALDAAPGITAVTTVQRDALAGVQRWTGRVVVNTTNGRLEWWDGDSWEPVGRGLPLSFHTTHTWAIPGEIAVEVGDADLLIPTTIRPAPGESVYLAAVDHKINSGTSVTFDITRNGAVVAGFGGLVSGVVATYTNPADVALAAGDKVKPDVSAVAGTPRNWEATITLLHVLTLA